MTTPTDHAAERRAGMLELVTFLREKKWPDVAQALADEIDRRYPPPEPERVWVKFVADVFPEYSRNSDGRWVYRRFCDDREQESGVTDDTVRALASLVPGLVAQPVQPTAWLNLHGDALNLYPDLPTARTRACGGCRIVPVVELPEVPRDA